MDQHLSYTHCELCPHKCGVNRSFGQRGFCKEGSRMRAARAALHYWEEPPLSNNGGSGAIFFTGCNLGCLYCQNEELSVKHIGFNISPTKLALICLNLQEKGAQNINLVTGTHYVPSIIEGIKLAKKRGMKLPVIWNTSGYERVKVIKALYHTVDIWLFDVKYAQQEISSSLSRANDYPHVALTALTEIAAHLECESNLTYTDSGAMQTGLIVRHLVLPGFLENTKTTLKAIRNTIGTEYPLSLMNQYTPNSWSITQKLFPQMAEPLSPKAYKEICDYAAELGFSHIFTQDSTSQDQKYLPKFNGFGINNI